MVHPNSLKNKQKDAAIKAVNIDDMSMSCASEIYRKNNHI